MTGKRGLEEIQRIKEKLSKKRKIESKITDKERRRIKSFSYHRGNFISFFLNLKKETSFDQQEIAFKEKFEYYLSENQIQLEEFIENLRKESISYQENYQVKQNKKYFDGLISEMGSFSDSLIGNEIYKRLFFFSKENVENENRIELLSKLNKIFDCLQEDFAKIENSKFIILSKNTSKNWIFKNIFSVLEKECSSKNNQESRKVENYLISFLFKIEKLTNPEIEINSFDEDSMIYETIKTSFEKKEKLEETLKKVDSYISFKKDFLYVVMENPKEWEKITSEFIEKKKYSWEEIDNSIANENEETKGSALREIFGIGACLEEGFLDKIFEEYEKAYNNIDEILKIKDKKSQKNVLHHLAEKFKLKVDVIQSVTEKELKIYKKISEKYKHLSLEKEKNKWDETPEDILEEAEISIEEGVLVISD